MNVFGTVSQLASWAGICPGNNESGGKRKSSRIPKGNVYLKTTLVEAANAAAQAKGTYLRDKFYRLKARRGYKRAAVALAHKILVAIYHMFSHRVSYHDLGDLYLDKLNKPPHTKLSSPLGAPRLHRDTPAERCVTPAEPYFHSSRLTARLASDSSGSATQPGPIAFSEGPSGGGS